MDRRAEQQRSLFLTERQDADTPPSAKRMREPIGRIDEDATLRRMLLPLCRLGYGEIWEDPRRGHRVGVLDATRTECLSQIVGGEQPVLFVNDPPYNVAVGGADSRSLGRRPLSEYIEFSSQWVSACLSVMRTDAHFYVWLGADYREGFQPLPDFMVMMREFPELDARNLITLRNQRGYGTQRNWMWVRQELLHYVRGNPPFRAVYTDIPKILKGYYKTVDGKLTENLERSKSSTIRPGNVWVDIQQIFYRMEENVPGCYAQKPLKAIERILLSSSEEGDTVVDCFSHSGSTLIAGEMNNRRVLTLDIDPICVELTIRRLERLRETGRTGWQCENPFPEIEAAHESG